MQSFTLFYRAFRTIEAFPHRFGSFHARNASERRFRLFKFVTEQFREGNSSFGQIVCRTPTCHSYTEHKSN
jgi:hypothetical protein